MNKQERIELLKEYGENIQKAIEQNGGKIFDNRSRKWMKLNTKVSETFRLMIQLEDLLIQLDDYQMKNGQEYTDLEEFSLQKSLLRDKFANYIDEHPELLEIDKYLKE